MNETPQLTTLPPQPVLSVRRQIPVSQLGPTLDACLKLLRAQLEQQRLQAAGAPFVRYHQFGREEADMEVGVPVATSGQRSGEVTASTRPGGPAVTLWHLGPHDKSFGDSYRKLHAWLTEQGREGSGPAWEVYEWLDVPTYDGSRPDSARWRTQLVQPVVPVKSPEPPVPHQLRGDLP